MTGAIDSRTTNDQRPTETAPKGLDRRRATAYHGARLSELYGPRVAHTSEVRVAQPGLGIAASLVAIALSLGFISLFDFPSFAGDVTFFTLCLIPMQVMAVVLWGANPPFVAKMGQPAKGLFLLVLTIAIAAIVFPLALAAAGEGISAAGPDSGALRDHRRADHVLPVRHLRRVAVHGRLQESGGLRLRHADRRLRGDLCDVPAVLQLRLPAGRARSTWRRRPRACSWA